MTWINAISENSLRFRGESVDEKATLMGKSLGVNPSGVLLKLRQLLQGDCQCVVPVPFECIISWPLTCDSGHCLITDKDVRAVIVSGKLRRWRSCVH